MSPERSEARTAQLRKRARRALERAGVRVGGEHLIEPIVDAIQVECEALRERVGMMCRQLHDQGDRLTVKARPWADDALLDLAVILEQHFVDADGGVGFRPGGEE